MMTLNELCKSGRFYIYTHAKPDGTIFYVGKGVGVRAKDFCRRNSFHNRITKKYGKENIRISAYEAFDERHAYAIERQLIGLIRRAGIHLCNVDPGGAGRLGVRITEEHKQKLRIAGMGHPVSAETRQRISEAGKGRVTSAATRAKLSAKKISPEHLEALLRSVRGRAVPEEQKARARAKMLGRTASAETREKLKLSHLGIKPSPETLAKRSISLKAAWARRKAQA